MSLPQSNIDVSGGVEFVSQPSLTWYINKETGRIQNSVSGLAAVRQAVEIILNVERFRWQIYGPYFGVSWSGLTGQDPGYAASELQRRIRDALSADRRVLGIEDFSCTVSGRTLTAELTVRTVYGDIRKTLEVQT